MTDEFRFTFTDSKIILSKLLQKVLLYFQYSVLQTIL